MAVDTDAGNVNVSDVNGGDDMDADVVVTSVSNVAKD